MDEDTTKMFIAYFYETKAISIEIIDKLIGF